MSWPAVAVLAAVAAGLLGTGTLLRWPALVAAGLGAVAVAYALGLHNIHSDARSVTTALVAGGLLVAGELCFCLVNRPAARDADETDSAVLPRRQLTWLAICGLGAIAAAVVVLAVASVHLGRSAALTVAGTAASVLALWLLTAAASGTAADKPEK